MHSITHSITESYSAKQMYDLVNDVDAYKTFIPGCVDSGIELQTMDEMIAFMEVEKLGIRKSFKTHNALVDGEEIAMQLIDGPFSSLEGKWTFTPLSESSCKITFSIQFAFKNKLVEMAFSPVFKEMIANMVRTFSQRAKLVYMAD